jgi:hypothetical protein
VVTTEETTDTELCLQQMQRSEEEKDPKEGEPKDVDVEEDTET